MRELKLKYFIELASNIGSKARTEAQALEASQKAMQAAVDKTSASVGRLDSAFMRFSANSATERQIGYMDRLTRSVGQAHARMELLGSAAMKVGKIGAAGFAAFTVGKAVLSQPLEQARSYERQLADTANVSYAGKDVAGKRLGMAELDKAVKGSLRGAGGKREDALGALNDMIASGVVTNEQAIQTLPSIMKYATAGNARPGELANLAVKLLQSGFKVDQMPVLLDKALVAGQAGGFELKDMAKWLPQLLASGKEAGLMGMHGYEKILSAAQASVTTAGTKDEAGTNLKDLLTHLPGHALKTAAKRMGIDAVGMLNTTIAGGGDTLDGAVALADYLIAHDPKAAALQKKLDLSGTQRDAKGAPVYSPEQIDIMQQQSQLLQGAAMGQLFHNQQSALALFALRNQRKYMSEVMGQVGGAKGQYGDDNLSLIAGTSDFKTQQLENEKLFAQTDAVSGVNAAMGKLADSTTDLYRKYPGYASNVEAAKLAIGALAAMAGAATAALAVLGFMGGRGSIAALPGLAGGAGAGAFPVLEGAAGAGTAAAGSALGTVGGLAVGGIAASFAATNILASNKGLRDGLEGNMFAGDAGLAAAILNATQAPELTNTHRGQGFNDPRLLTLTAPSVADQALELGKATEIKLGEGSLAINVSVNDERVSATTNVLNPLPLVRLNAGATNPGGF
jgi:Phage-related minor tail protein